MWKRLSGSTLICAWLSVLSVAVPLVAVLSACGAAQPGEPRYPEKKRPEPLRSASDGEVLGAHGQSPADTLEGSPTNEHPAPGWVLEDGKPVPNRERGPASARAASAVPGGVAPAAEEADPEDCVKPSGSSGAAASTDREGKKKRPCPPLPAE